MRAQSPETETDDRSDSPGEGARRSSLVESTASGLVQLDVSIRGPEDIIKTLTVDDFDVVVGGRDIDSFSLDRICGTGDEALTASAPAREEEQERRPSSMFVPSLESRE